MTLGTDVADVGIAELIAKAVAGDQTALQRLLLTYYDDLLRHIERRLPSSIQGAISAADVLQQTFIQAFRHISRFKGDSATSFFAWLKTIAERGVKDAHKFAQRKKRGAGLRQLHTGRTPQASTLAHLAERLACSGTPSQSVARREAVQAVQVAIASLPEDYQQAVRLRYFDGKSVEQAADAMGRTPGAIRGMIDRAKGKLRAAIGRLSVYK
jgi:RNA polymerase sigma-70 factor (ECF subfamily)